MATRSLQSKASECLHPVHPSRICTGKSYPDARSRNATPSTPETQTPEALNPKTPKALNHLQPGTLKPKLQLGCEDLLSQFPWSALSPVKDSRRWLQGCTLWSCVFKVQALWSIHGPISQCPRCRGFKEFSGLTDVLGIRGRGLGHIEMYVLVGGAMLADFAVSMPLLPQQVLVAYC